MKRFRFFFCMLFCRALCGDGLFFRHAHFAGEGLRRGAALAEAEDAPGLARGEGAFLFRFQFGVHEREERLRGGEFFVGPGAFHGEEAAPFFHEGEGPLGDHGEAFHRAGGDHVEGLAELFPPAAFFGAHVEAFHVLRARGGPRFFHAAQFFLDGVHEDELHVRPEEGEDHAGKARAGAEVERAAACGEPRRVVAGEGVVHVLYEAFFFVPDAREVDGGVQIQDAVVVGGDAGGGVFAGFDGQRRENIGNCHRDSPFVRRLRIFFLSHRP